jgi:hypothetical protein
MHAGAALGTGSAMAHRAIDGLMGPRGGGGGEAAAPAAAAPEAYAAGPSPEERCAQQAKAFAECMSRNSGDMAACQFYFESMQVCCGACVLCCIVVVRACFQRTHLPVYACHCVRCRRPASGATHS